jgi:uncharacterized protein (DUF924 family)
MDGDAREILDFWIGLGAEGWYRADDTIDATIRDRWSALWETARDGGLSVWRAAPDSCLALVLLLDQFPRNMFRQDPRAFSSDNRAIAVARTAILHGQDKRVESPLRQFFYMPLMHSELQSNQDQAVRLFLINFGHGELLHHAQAHREIIRRFGRFPYRNAALGRESTPEELVFLNEGGYRAIFDEIAA